MDRIPLTAEGADTVKMETDAATLAGYAEVCRSYERIDDFRAKLLGFLPVVSGAGLFLILGEDGGAAEEQTALLAVSGTFGAIITIGLLCFEARGFQRCVRLVTVGKDFERSMGIEGWFARWPQSVGRKINEPFAAGLIYSAVLSAWVYVALASWSTAVAIPVAVVSLLVGLFATRALYWRVTWEEELRRRGKLAENRRGPLTENRWTRWFDRHVGLEAESESEAPPLSGLTP